MTKFSTIVAMLVAAATPAAAQDPSGVLVPADGTGDGREQVRGDEITPESQEAIDRGLAWLAEQQRPDGSIGSGGTAITSLGAIAFMSAGHLPGRGEYGDVVAKAVDNVLAQAQPSGLLAGANGGGVMYQHGFATLLLGEVYGMTGEDRVQEPLRRAIRLIEQSQNPQGGWRYQPVPVDADVSVTICQVMALRAARDAGVKVERKVIDDAIAYIRECQNSDGGFNYMLGAGQNSAFPRSAAGVATLYYAGVSEGEAVDNGLAYLLRFLPGQRISNTRHHYFYGQYYAAQAMFLAGGEYWQTWYPAIRTELLTQQAANGSWSGDNTVEYSTSMALIVLQMPNRYLPVFSGKGPGS